MKTMPDNMECVPIVRDSQCDNLSLVNDASTDEASACSLNVEAAVLRSSCSLNAEAAVLRQLKTSFLVLRCQYTKHWVPTIATFRRAVVSDGLERDALQTLMRQLQLFEAQDSLVLGLEEFPELVPIMCEKLREKIRPLIHVVKQSLALLADVANTMSEESSSCVDCYERRQEAIGADRDTHSDVTTCCRLSVAELVDMLVRLDQLLRKDISLRRSLLEKCLDNSSEKHLDDFVNYWSTESEVDSYFNELLFLTQFFIE